MDGEAAVSIRVRVRLFAVLRERAGTGEVTVELPEGATVADVREMLLRELPKLEGFSDRVAFAVNQDYVRSDTPLKDGDEVALIPPVSGGSESDVPSGCHAHARVGMQPPRIPRNDVEERRKRCKRYNERGHAHFLTFSCFRRQPFLTKDRTRGWMIEAINLSRDRHQFDLWAYVIMPEHVHLILFPRFDDYDISRILSTLKQPVAKRAWLFVRKEAPLFLDRMTDRQPNGKSTIRFWQRGGGYDSNLWNPKPIWEAIDYVHNNPVKRGLCQSAEQWRWSSAADYMELGAGPVSIQRELLPPRP